MKSETVSALSALVPVAKQTATIAGKTVDVFPLDCRITILTPTYDYSLTEYYRTSLALAQEHVRAHFRMPDGSVQQLPVIADRINVPNDSHIDRARNVVTNVWIRTNQTRFALSIDADIEFFPQHIARTWLHLLNGHRFVCGHYAMKCLKPTFVANVKGGTRRDPTTGLIELLDGGTGWMAHDRSVLIESRKHPEVKPYLCAPNTPWPGQVFWSYYSSGVYGPVDQIELTPGDKADILAAKGPEAFTKLQQWLSEDWKLCRVWQELGGTIQGDTEIKLRHFGRMLYPPLISELVDATACLIEHKNPGMAEHVDRLTTALTKWRELPAPGLKAA